MMNDHDTHVILRPDLMEIARLIEPHSRVLDIGSGDGALLAYLQNHKQVHGRGIERKQKRVNQCLVKGLSVIQGDAEEELREYPSASFDYVVLSRTLPATKNPIEMIQQMLRIGKAGIISMPNFGYWRVRLHLLLKGTMPVTKSLDMPWYETENIHLCTIRDFYRLAKKMRLRITHCYGFTGDKKHHFTPHNRLMNLCAEEAVFMIKYL